MMLLLAGLAAAVFVLQMFAADVCAAGDSDDKDTIVLRAWGVPTGSSNISDIATLKVLEAFYKKHPDIRAVSSEGLRLPGGSRTMNMVPLMQIAGDMAADVIFVNFRQSHTYISNKFLYPLDEYIEKIKGGWTDVDVIICTPSVMAKIGPIGRILGPRGLMPNPKTGTVTMEVGKAVHEVKAGKIDFKVDKTGIIHSSIGKVSFDARSLQENAQEFLNTILKLKPQALKGTYVKSIYLSTTMGPGLCIDVKSGSAAE